MGKTNRGCPGAPAHKHLPRCSSESYAFDEILGKCFSVSELTLVAAKLPWAGAPRGKKSPLSNDQARSVVFWPFERIFFGDSPPRSEAKGERIPVV